MDKELAIQKALPLIKQFEGCKLKAYVDQGGRVTIGWGYTGGIQLGEEWSQQEADEALDRRVREVCDQVLGAVKVPLNENQCAALIDFTYNLGIGNLMRSGLLRLINRSRIQDASDQFLLWTYIGHYKSEGLLHRREAERKLFLT